ncbi:MAG: hypothetical protein HC853_08325 [Anaerolineae bacterium]|nr:hypothetical protein [Anaerolineae bacterium]
MSIPHRSGYRVLIPLAMEVIPDEQVDSLHGDAIKLKANARQFPNPESMLRLAEIYGRIIKGQAVWINSGRPWFRIPVNRSDLISVTDDSEEPRAFYIKEELCQ